MRPAGVWMAHPVSLTEESLVPVPAAPLSRDVSGQTPAHSSRDRRVSLTRKHVRVTVRVPFLPGRSYRADPQAEEHLRDEQGETPSQTSFPRGSLNILERKRLGVAMPPEVLT